MTTTEHLDRIGRALESVVESASHPTLRNNSAKARESLRVIRQQFEELANTNAGSPTCVRCGSPYLAHGQCSRHAEGCQGGIGEGSPVTLPASSPDTHKSGVGVTACEILGRLADKNNWSDCSLSTVDGDDYDAMAWSPIDCDLDQDGRVSDPLFHTPWKLAALAMAQPLPASDTDSPDARTRVKVLDADTEALQSNYEAQDTALTAIYIRCGGKLELGDTAGNYDPQVVVRAVEGRIAEIERELRVTKLRAESAEGIMRGLTVERDAAVDALADCSYRLLLRIATLEGAP